MRRDFRRRPCALFAPLAGLLLANCAALPDVGKHVERNRGAPVELATAHGGVLSPEQSAAILKRLKQGSALDILQKHIAIEEVLVGGSPLTLGNQVTLLEDGPATYAAMVDAIRNARDHINLETYIIEDDKVGTQFADLLLAQQARGIQVNLIYDSVGAIGTGKRFFERLRKAGIAVLEYNPINPAQVRTTWNINNRDHRKILIVDGKVAFIGGINIADAYTSGSIFSRARRPRADSKAWRDTHVRIAGPVVADLQNQFMETWKSQKGEPLQVRRYFPKLKKQGEEIVRVVADHSADKRSEIYLTLISAIIHAEKSVHITTAYFVPDEQLVKALQDAAQRGVDVKLILPSATDYWLVLHAGRWHYTDLLGAGVQIYERRGRVLHAKSATVDGVWSCVGSTNLDWRSFLHNDEINAVILGRSFNQQMETMFARDLQNSDRVDPDNWRTRPLLPRLKEITGRIWEYWL